MFEAGHGRLLPSSGFFLVESLVIVGAVFVKCCHINKTKWNLTDLFGAHINCKNAIYNNIQQDFWRDSN